MKFTLSDMMIPMFPGLLLLFAPFIALVLFSFGCIDINVPDKFVLVHDVRVRMVDDTGDSGILERSWPSEDKTF